MNTKFKANGLTRLRIKPQPTAPNVDARATRPFQLLNCNTYVNFLLDELYTQVGFFCVEEFFRKQINFCKNFLNESSGQKTNMVAIIAYGNIPKQ